MSAPGARRAGNDMRLLLALATALLVAATAHAQTGQLATTTAVAVTPLDGPISSDAMIKVPVHIAYSYTLGLSTVPTAIEVTIAELPPWAMAHISPSVVYINVLEGQTQGVQVTRHAVADLVLTATEDAPHGAVGTVKVTAHAKENGDLKSSSGTDATFVKAATAEACHHEEAHADGNATAETEPVEITTQTAGVAPVAGPLVGALAVAGAAAGGMAAMRRKK